MSFATPKKNRSKRAKSYRDENSGNSLNRSYRDIIPLSFFGISAITKCGKNRQSTTSCATGSCNSSRIGPRLTNVSQPKHLEFPIRLHLGVLSDRAKFQPAAARGSRLRRRSPVSFVEWVEGLAVLSGLETGLGQLDEVERAKCEAGAAYLTVSWLHPGCHQVLVNLNNRLACNIRRRFRLDSISTRSSPIDIREPFR